MDSCSWIHGYTNADATGSNNSFMSGYAASCCSPGEFPQQQQLVSSQIQHHLNQISMHMSIDDESAVSSMLDDLLKASSSTHHGGAGSFPSSSSSSASFRSASVSCSPQSSAAAPELPATGGVFRRYARHLRPRRLPKPGACGQRMFKTAMSVLAKMHVAATFSRQYYYQQAVSALAAAAEAAPPPSGNQLQHMISERKRREKLNDSFLALKAVLPPGSKKDKASILTRAREHVKSLESKLSELEEKNRELRRGWPAAPPPSPPRTTKARRRRCRTPAMGRSERT